ncbi:MAG: WG repeat-containing protein [Paludibacter sp.]|nr:WG repeat-containing protein [Bacteroidales bacterium]MCM1068321.1 WG repeat-containing protein [Prevotella sp.]MCM1354052.1 WG repeat-containing protein [Bacteroides sp.]MCM1442106.1 WG repeat-containing protein [Muribaculum sp.]MCM1482000.1 WG repeat-containing protein [Paludibacter sp.]
MKTNRLITRLMLFTVLLTGCKEHQTPETDTTDLWPAMSGNKFGYINRKGAFAIQPYYDEVSSFSCGYAMVEMNDRDLFINKKGDIQSTPSFDDAEDFYYNYAVVEIDNGLGMFDKKFRYAIQPVHTGLGNMTADGLVAAQISGGKWGFVDASGRVKIQPVYDQVGGFLDGLACVALNSKWGAIDKRGQYVISAVYDLLSSVGENRILFKENGKYGLLDTKGNVKVQPVYTMIGHFYDNGLAPVSDGTGIGYINTKGDLVIPMSYKSAMYFSEGYAFVVSGDKWMLIDTKGNICLTLAPNEKPQIILHNGLFLTLTADNNSYTYQYKDVKGNTIYAWTLNGSSMKVRSCISDTDLSNPKEQTLCTMPTKNYRLQRMAE